MTFFINVIAQTAVKIKKVTTKVTVRSSFNFLLLLQLRRDHKVQNLMLQFLYLSVVALFCPFILRPLAKRGYQDGVHKNTLGWLLMGPQTSH